MSRENFEFLRSGYEAYNHTGKVERGRLPADIVIGEVPGTELRLMRWGTRSVWICRASGSCLCAVAACCGG
jgi:hypothetical protein